MLAHGINRRWSETKLRVVPKIWIWDLHKQGSPIHKNLKEKQMLPYQSVKKGRKKNVSTWEIEYFLQMVLTTCLLKTIDHNPLQPNPQKIVIQEGMNLLQHMQIISMEMEHNTILGQKNVGK